MNKLISIFEKISEDKRIFGTIEFQFRYVLSGKGISPPVRRALQFVPSLHKYLAEMLRLE